MAGRFEGLTDAQWQLLEPLLPKDPEQRGRGSPHAPWRQVCNTILWILITHLTQSSKKDLIKFVP